VSVRALPLVVLLVLATACCAACGGAQRSGVVDPGPRGTLRFQGSPAEASVEVDEDRVGPLRMFTTHGLLLRPGQHRVVVRAEGYFPEYRLVEIKESEVTVLAVDLRAVPE
jgi:hypothetical protein